MAFNTGAALLDAIVLAVVAQEEHGTYGYKITQEVRQVLDLSESTLYPVLRRLQKDGCRYYEVTAAGQARLQQFQKDWDAYTGKINKLFKGELL